ncbi:MAG TPA: glycosyltransferase family 1 protein, partial [Thermoguttaceae bacterium]|nr:glycosyltransferase family 1 protein [Thermoguttaceae bacterium]
DQTGYLVRPKDVEGLAGAVVRLAGDPELRARLGEEGRRRCVEQFRHERMTDQLRALYEELLRANST